MKCRSFFGVAAAANCDQNQWMLSAIVEVNAGPINVDEASTFIYTSPVQILESRVDE